MEGAAVTKSVNVEVLHLWGRTSSFPPTAQSAIIQGFPTASSGRLRWLARLSGIGPLTPLAEHDSLPGHPLSSPRRRGSRVANNGSLDSRLRGNHGLGRYDFLAFSALLLPTQVIFLHG